MKPYRPLVVLSLAAAGCAPRPVTMAPPMAPAMAPPVASAPMGAPAAPVQSGVNGVYDWRDVPPGQQVPINRAVFDQGGYQLYAASGETIVVPFVNQNMYVMKFGRTSAGMHFVNDGNVPTLYLPGNGSLENAAAQGARWYPFSSGHHYERPVYIGLAPTWGDFVGMGWYPGMAYYGGYWGYRPWVPGFAFTPMIGLNFNIGGRPYYGWNSYQSYYRSNPGNRVGWGNSRSYNYSSVGRRAPSSSSFGRSAAGSTGSFGSGRSAGRSTFGSSRPSTSTGSFGGGRSTFGSSSGSSGFGTGRSTFGASRPSTSTGSFGGGTSGFGSSSRRPTSSFGGGTSGFGSSGRSSFGGSSGRSSFGGGSFGGSSGRSSFGGSSSGRSSFGGGRRR